MLSTYISEQNVANLDCCHIPTQSAVCSPIGKRNYNDILVSITTASEGYERYECTLGTRRPICNYTCRVMREGQSKRTHFISEWKADTLWHQNEQIAISASREALLNSFFNDKTP